MIGKKLKYLREIHDISQAELADALHVSRQSISLYEIDKRDPDFTVLKKICTYFGVTADYFIFENAPDYSPPNLSDNEVEVVNAMRQSPESDPPIVDKNFAAVIRAVSQMPPDKLQRLADYVGALDKLPDDADGVAIVEKHA